MYSAPPWINMEISCGILGTILSNNKDSQKNNKYIILVYPFNLHFKAHRLEEDEISILTNGS